MLPILTPDELAEEIKTGKPVIVDFYNDNCGPCKMIELVLASLTKKFPEVRFVKVDLIAHPEEMNKRAIDSFPTTMIFKDGREHARYTGVPQKDTIAEALGMII